MAKRKLKKIKQHPVKLSTLQAILVISPALLIILAVIFVAFCFWVWNRWENEDKLPKVLTNKEYNEGRQYPIDEFKTYTNKEFGFSIKYPATGYVQDPSCFEKGICSGKVHLGQCGNDITQSTLNGKPLITIDNMFGIIVSKFDGSIDEYFKSQNLNFYDYEASFPEFDKFNKSSPNSIVRIDGLKPNVKLSVPSPIAYPSYFVLNKQYFFNIVPLQNLGSKVGCLPPAGTHTNIFESLNWNIPKSITFN